MGRYTYKPAKVQLVRVPELAMPHVKTMLEFLGVALRMQPKSRPDKDRMLTERIAAAVTGFSITSFSFWLIDGKADCTCSAMRLRLSAGS